MTVWVEWNEIWFIDRLGLKWLDWSSASNGSMAALEGGSGRLGTALSYPCLASVSSVSATTTTAAPPASVTVGSAPVHPSPVSSNSVTESELLATVVSPPSPNLNQSTRYVCVIWFSFSLYVSLVRYTLVVSNLWWNNWWYPFVINKYGM